MLPGLLEHKYGRRVVLQLLAPFHNRYLPVEYQEWVRPSSEEGKTTSLKVAARSPPNDTRRGVQRRPLPPEKDKLRFRHHRVSISRTVLYARCITMIFENGSWCGIGPMLHEAKYTQTKGALS